MYSSIVHIKVSGSLNSFTYMNEHDSMFPVCPTSSSLIQSIIDREGVDCGDYDVLGNDIAARDTIKVCDPPLDSRETSLA